MPSTHECLNLFPRTGRHCAPHPSSRSFTVRPWKVFTCSCSACILRRLPLAMQWPRANPCQGHSDFSPPAQGQPAHLTSPAPPCEHRGTMTDIPFASVILCVPAFPSVFHAVLHAFPCLPLRWLCFSGSPSLYFSGLLHVGPGVRDLHIQLQVTRLHLNVWATGPSLYHRHLGTCGDPAPHSPLLFSCLPLPSRPRAFSSPLN